MDDSEYGKILDLVVDLRGDRPKTTIRWYLQKILSRVWEQKECFDGKRPFGNSGWGHDLYAPLVKAGYVENSVEEDGDLDDASSEAAYEIISNLIDYIFRSTKKS